MKQETSIRFNYIMNMIYTVSGMVFPLLIYPHAARILGESGIGAVSFANSIVSTFGIFAQLGIPTYGIKACAEVRDDKEKLTRVVHEILLINLITCAVTYLVFFAAVLAYPKFRAEKELFLVMSSVLFFNTIGVEWLYKGLEKYQYITCCSLFFKVIGVAATFLLIRSESDYVIYGGITILSLVGSNVLNFINLRKYIYLHPVGNYNFRRHLKMISIFLAMSVATTIYTNMDSAMLGIIKGTGENGYYDVAVKVKNILVSVVSSLGTVLLPRMSFYISSNRKQEFHRITQKALRFILVISLPICVYFILFAKPSVDLLAGERFAPSIRPMQIIMPTLVFIGLTNIIGMQMMVPLGMERQVLYSEIAGAAVNVIMNFFLIPELGCRGAAIGTLAAEIMVFFVQLFVMRKSVVFLFQKMSYGKLTAALLAAAAASVWVYRLHMGSLITLIISGGLFFGVYGIALLLLKEEMVRELWQQAVACIRKQQS